MERKHERLATPWAAGVAGVVFAILMAAAIVLMRIALPAGAGGDDATVIRQSSRGRRTERMNRTTTDRKRQRRGKI